MIHKRALKFYFLLFLLINFSYSRVINGVFQRPVIAAGVIKAAAVGAVGAVGAIGGAALGTVAAVKKVAAAGALGAIGGAIGGAKAIGTAAVIKTAGIATAATVGAIKTVGRIGSKIVNGVLNSNTNIGITKNIVRGNTVTSA